MIYKVIEDKKFEYKVVEANLYQIKHNQLDSLCDGYDGWEAFGVKEINDDKFLVFLKRSYIEVEK